MCDMTLENICYGKGKFVEKSTSTSGASLNCKSIQQECWWTSVKSTCDVSLYHW